MPLKMKKTVQQMVDEASAEIETVAQGSNRSSPLVAATVPGALADYGDGAIGYAELACLHTWFVGGPPGGNLWVRRPRSAC